MSPQPGKRDLEREVERRLFVHAQRLFPRNEIRAVFAAQRHEQRVVAEAALPHKAPKFRIARIETRKRPAKHIRFMFAQIRIIGIARIRGAQRGEFAPREKPLFGERF